MIHRQFNDYANNVIASIPDSEDYSVQYLLYTSLQSLSSVTILLEQVFLMIDVIITLIAAYVIYILVTTSVKEKVYETCSIVILLDLKWHYSVLWDYDKLPLHASFSFKCYYSLFLELFWVCFSVCCATYYWLTHSINSFFFRFLMHHQLPPMYFRFW